MGKILLLLEDLEYKCKQDYFMFVEDKLEFCLDKFRISFLITLLTFASPLNDTLHSSSQKTCPARPDIHSSGTCCSHHMCARSFALRPEPSQAEV